MFSKSFRLEEKKIAYKAQIDQLVRYQLRVRVSYFAEAMSDPLYRRMIEIGDARRWISDTVREAELSLFVDSMNADENERQAVESFYETLRPAKEVSWFKDRLALVLWALGIFAVYFVIAVPALLAIMALIGRLK